MGAVGGICVKIRERPVGLRASAGRLPCTSDVSGWNSMTVCRRERTVESSDRAKRGNCATEGTVRLQSKFTTHSRLVIEISNLAIISWLQTNLTLAPTDAARLPQLTTLLFASHLTATCIIPREACSERFCRFITQLLFGTEAKA